MSHGDAEGQDQDPGEKGVAARRGRGAAAPSQWKDASIGLVYLAVAVAGFILFALVFSAAMFLGGAAIMAVLVPVVDVVGLVWVRIPKWVFLVAAAIGWYLWWQEMRSKHQ